jgi:flavin-dependent dehydrogenase
MIACDVVVVGAGPAGCAAAIRTAQAGLSTVLLHSPRPRHSWAGESLPPGMTRLVTSVFGSGMLTEDRHRKAMGTRSVWGSDELVETDFLRNPLGEGWLLDRERFDADARTVAAAAGVRVIALRHRARIVRGVDGWQVGTELASRRLVDATGRSASVLRTLGIRRSASDRQIALVAVYPDDGDTYAGTTVEAVSEGWWYTTPLPGGLRVLAYLTDADLWRRGARDWHALLGQTRHIARCAGPGASSADPAACPADTRMASRLAGPDWIAVGDAAASFDPLSSQGMATAVLMGARGGEALSGPDPERAVAEWAGAYALIVAEHASHRSHYARQESRWPMSDFWRRRQSIITSSAMSMAVRPTPVGSPATGAISS